MDYVRCCLAKKRIGSKSKSYYSRDFLIITEALTENNAKRERTLEFSKFL